MILSTLATNIEFFVRRSLTLRYDMLTQTTTTTTTMRWSVFRLSRQAGGAGGGRQVTWPMLYSVLDVLCRWSSWWNWWSEHVSGAWAADLPLTAQAYFCDTRSPLRGSPAPAPLPLTRFSARSAPITCSKTFLADRTNGRAIATLLRLSVRLSVCLWRYVLWLNGAS